MMKIRKLKFGKLFLVVFLTVLIWVWADLAQDESFPVPGGATIILAKTNPNIWATFTGGLQASQQLAIDKIVLRGPVGKISGFRRDIRDDPQLMDFILDHEQQGWTEQGGHPLDVKTFLNKRVQRHGLIVESVEPTRASVSITNLVKKTLTVQCFDEELRTIQCESIEPAKVDMFVPSMWEGDSRTAKVILTRAEQNQARIHAVEKTPYIELPDGQIRKSIQPVRISLPSTEERLRPYQVTGTLAIAMSPILQGKYKVEILNLEMVLRAIQLEATPEAKIAYEQQEFPPPVTLYILDEDRINKDEIRREVVYNFPKEYVQRGEIRLKQQPVEVRFKLIPITQENL